MLTLIEPTQERIALDDLLVVKIGGGAGLDLDYCLQDIASIAQERPVIVVHGVSAMMDQLCEERGLAVRTLTSPTGHSSRYTDAATREVFVQACERVNADIVDRLNTLGIHAEGLTDHRVPINGERKAAIRAVVDGRRCIVRDDYSGSITDVNTDELFAGLQQGVVYVVPPIAYSDDGFLNIDGDRAAAAIAGALGADQLVILSNVRGLYRDFNDATTLVDHLELRQIDAAMDMAGGRMKRKVLAAQEAMEGGVSSVVIADGRTESPIQAALNGAGTEFTR